MSLKEIKKLISTLGIPVAYDHFTSKKNPPIIAYRELPIDTFMADDYNYSIFKSYEIELCTIKKDCDLESSLITRSFINVLAFHLSILNKGQNSKNRVIIAFFCVFWLYHSYA